MRVRYLGSDLSVWPFGYLYVWMRMDILERKKIWAGKVLAIELGERFPAGMGSKNWMLQVGRVGSGVDPRELNSA